MGVGAESSSQLLAGPAVGHAGTIEEIGDRVGDGQPVGLMETGGDPLEIRRCGSSAGRRVESFGAGVRRHRDVGVPTEAEEHVVATVADESSLAVGQ